MIRFAVRRVAFGLVAVWLAASLAFVLAHLAPGGPAVALGGEHGAPGHIEAVSRAYGLDRPLPVVYLDWLSRVARGDLGVSYRYQAPVARLIIERVPVTLAVMLPAIVLAGLVGVLAGLWMAGRERGSRALAAVLVGLGAVPSYVVAQTLVLVFAVRLGWFPVQGLIDPRADLAGTDLLVDLARRLVLPILSLAIVQLGFVALLARARVGEEMRRPYVATARMKGLGVGTAKRRHALANAMLPLVTLVAWRLGAVVGGVVVVETVFALPGLGRLAVTAAMARDHPTVIGIVLTATAVVVAVNVVADIVARALDPRLAEARP